MGLTVFADKGVGKDSPVIIGIPGFVSTLSGGRIEDVLQQLSKEGFIGYGVTFSDIKQEEDTVICNFNLENYMNDIYRAFKAAETDERADMSRVGVLASSVGGGVFAHYLNRANSPEVDSYVSISPVAGWNYYGNEEMRTKARTAPFCPIPSEDGMKRVIPNESVAELERVDGLSALKEYEYNDMRVMTLFGKDDQVVDIESIRKYHTILGGRPEDIIGYECGHAVPHDESKKRIIDFFRADLLVEEYEKMRKLIMEGNVMLDRGMMFGVEGGSYESAGDDAKAALKLFTQASEQDRQGRYSSRLQTKIEDAQNMVELSKPIEKGSPPRQDEIRRILLGME